jgi:hypothetical protein
VEVPNLRVSAIGCLDDHVSVVDQVKISIVWELRDYMEWSFDVETELFIQLSLLWLSLPLINIHNVPLLMDAIVFVVDSNVPVLLIDIALNLNNLSSFVNNK